MRTIVFTAVLFLVILILSNCHSSKSATSNVPKLTYEANMLTLISSNCSPCHIPSKGGNKLPLDNYANVKTNIDEMIRRIELNPGDKGFMPFKRAKLSDSVIAVFKQFRSDGVLEK